MNLENPLLILGILAVVSLAYIILFGGMGTYLLCISLCGKSKVKASQGWKTTTGHDSILRNRPPGGAQFQCEV